MDITRMGRNILTVLCLTSCSIFSIGLIFTWTNREGMMSPTGVPMGADLLQHHEAARFASRGSWTDLYQNSHLGNALYTRNHPGETREVEGFDYVYPPLVAWAGIPFAGWDYLTWVAGWQVVVAGCYAASFWLLSKGRPQNGTDGIVALGLPVFYYGVILAQNSSLSLLVISACAFLLMGKRPWWAGLVLSCLFYKPQIGLAAAGFLFLTGQWRCAFAFGFGSLAWLATGWWACGPDATLAWFEVLQRMLGGSQKQVAELHQSLPGTLKILLGRDAPSFFAPLVSLAGMFVFSFIALLAGWKDRWQPRSPESLLFLALAAWTLFSPYVMHYDLLLATPWWWWNMKRDLEERTPKWVRPVGLAAAASFWLASLLSINPENLPITPALPFLILWFVWTIFRMGIVRAATVSTP